MHTLVYRPTWRECSLKLWTNRWYICHFLCWLYKRRRRLKSPIYGRQQFSLLSRQEFPRVRRNRWKKRLDRRSCKQDDLVPKIGKLGGDLHPWCLQSVVVPCILARSSHIRTLAARNLVVCCPRLRNNVHEYVPLASVIILMRTITHMRFKSQTEICNFIFLVF